MGWPREKAEEIGREKRLEGCIVIGISPGRKYYAGSWGIDRVACRRFGRILDLVADLLDAGGGVSGD